MGKARKWTLSRTLWLTFICGIGHVLGSVLLGAVGALAGWSLGSLEAFESMRGDLAAWLLVAFGLGYLLWALRRLNRGHSHSHVHAHADGTVHDHEHSHDGSHAHAHTEDATVKSITGWSLFVIFVFGPCEALIPLLLFPALAEDLSLAVMVCAVFALSTLVTMLSMVWALSKGSERVRFKFFGRYGHVLAGLVILGCGSAIHLGL
ncbi:sulfite exporter TauE/SafE family protein [Coraliomargarita akajimensis]|nr:sulfite exporter TauE/SafE family protein [Coraliomargarita akajimensis]